MLGKLEEDLVLSMGRQRNGQVLSSEEYQLLRGGPPSCVSRSKNAREHRNCLPHTREPQPCSVIQGQQDRWSCSLRIVCRT